MVKDFGALPVNYGTRISREPAGGAGDLAVSTVQGSIEVDQEARVSGREAPFQHRIVFVGAWLLLAIALLRYPGSGARSFFTGMIVGSWPFLFIGSAAFALNKVVVIGTVLGLSGGSVALCAWSADSARLPRETWSLLIVGVLLGGAVSYGGNKYTFGDWKNSPVISQAVEVNYVPTRQKYHEDITIPKTLAGAMLGFYLAVASIFVYSLSVKASAGEMNQAQPDEVDTPSGARNARE